MKHLVAVILASIALSGCGRIENYFSHAKSRWIGLDRTVTLYAADGKVIRAWKVDNQIEYPGSAMRFVDSEGKTITITGTIIAEEQ